MAALEQDNLAGILWANPIGGSLTQGEKPKFLMSNERTGHGPGGFDTRNLKLYFLSLTFICLSAN